MIQAASAINGEVRPTAASIRPEVALLVAERRDREGPVVVVSPAGPLTRSELELVQGVGDPLTLADLLPAQPVVVGEHWRVRNAAAQAVSGYDVVTSNNLDAAWNRPTATKARIRLKGQIQGSALGGAGTMTCEGFLTFDRQAGRIDRLDLNRIETRQAGTGRGRAGCQEHAHRDPQRGRAARDSLQCRAGRHLPGDHPRSANCCG